MADTPRGPDPRTAPPPADGHPKRPWRVSPAPDGRGAPPQRQPMLPFSLRRFVTILAVLFLVNWLLVQVLAPAKEVIRVPYTPTFIAQVKAGNVKEIAAEGDTVQGRVQEGGHLQGRQGEELQDRDPVLRQRQRPVGAPRGEQGDGERGAARRALAFRDDPVQLRPDHPAGGAVRLVRPASGGRGRWRRRARASSGARVPSASRARSRP